MAPVDSILAPKSLNFTLIMSYLAPLGTENGTFWHKKCTFMFVQDEKLIFESI